MCRRGLKLEKQFCPLFFLLEEREDEETETKFTINTTTQFEARHASTYINNNNSRKLTKEEENEPVYLTYNR